MYQEDPKALHLQRSHYLCLPRDRLQVPCAEFPKDDDRLTFIFRVMVGNWSQVTTVNLRPSAYTWRTGRG